MGQVRVKVRSAKGLHRVLKDYTERITTAALDELMDDASSYAWDRYENAKYAGVDPLDEDEGVTVNVEELGPLTREVSAEGEIVKFIEYGTGVRATSDAAGASFKSFWFFNDDEGRRDIVTNEFVQNAKPRMRKYYYAEDENGRFREELPEPELDERDGVFFTHGNPPNYIMRDTEEWVKEHLPEYVKKHSNDRHRKHRD